MQVSLTCTSKFENDFQLLFIMVFILKDKFKIIFSYCRKKESRQKRKKYKKYKERGRVIGKRRNKKRKYAAGDQTTQKSDQSVLQLLSVVMRSQCQNGFRNIISIFCQEGLDKKYALVIKKKKKIKAFTAKSGILLISILSILLFTTGPAPN